MNIAATTTRQATAIHIKVPMGFIRFTVAFEDGPPQLATWLTRRGPRPGRLQGGCPPYLDSSTGMRCAGEQKIQPAKRVAVLACMDARLDVEDLLGRKPAMRTSSATPAA